MLVTELLLSIPCLTQPQGNDSLWKDCNVNAPPLSPELESLAHARIKSPSSAPPMLDAREIKRSQIGLLQNPMMEDSINLGDASGVQSRGKGKKAAKKAQQAKWQGSENGDNAPNGEGGNDAEGGGGGADGGGNSNAGGNGDGGAGGGAGGDDGDDWDFGGKKNKKNKKKAKQEEEKKTQEEEEDKARQEEEDKARQEEEDEIARQEEEGKKTQEEEQRRKKEEDAAAANTLSWANDTNDANVDTEWAGFSTKKKKKGKKVSNATLHSSKPMLKSCVPRAAK